MSEVEEYLAELELALVTSPALFEYEIVRSWTHTDAGYLRMRGFLTNGDFVEMAEYFVLQAGEVVVTDYRHKWMTGDKSLLRNRWDSTPDHPELTGFPFHVHIGAEADVQPDTPRSLPDVLRLIEAEVVG